MKIIINLESYKIRTILDWTWLNLKFENDKWKWQQKNWTQKICLLVFLSEYYWNFF